jgi:hypothetical protein
VPIEYFSLSNHWTPVVSEGYNAEAFLKGSCGATQILVIARFATARPAKRLNEFSATQSL